MNRRHTVDLLATYLLRLRDEAGRLGRKLHRPSLLGGKIELEVGPENGEVEGVVHLRERSLDVEAPELDVEIERERRASLSLRPAHGAARDDRHRLAGETAENS